jgi:predicted metal-dependent phosphoesterase TrpH
VQPISTIRRARPLSAFFLVTLSCLAAAAQAPPFTGPAPNLSLRGQIHASDNHTYVAVPFRVPPGVHRLTITFAYTGRDQRTTIDLSLYDPQRFRGSSGGNKSEFTVADTDATPSYLPGPILPGDWKLVLGVPNIRAGVTSRYTAQVWFDRALEDRSFTDTPLRTGPAWYRGDLHLHDAHSDGSCTSQGGRKVPCPLYVTVDAASRRGLDFIAITDHNAQSQYGPMRELQPFFDRTLLIPGREITTFHGHMNMWGSTRWVDYRVGTKSVPDINHVIDAAHALGAVVSINHPQDPTGEDCMGCGWDQDPPADMAKIDAIEIINGGHDAGLEFWEKQLSQGHRITAVGGSDNHNATRPLTEPGSVGWPTTVVEAGALSVDAILAGIRAGHVFVDVDGTSGVDTRTLDVTASSGKQNAGMGDSLTAPAGVEVHFTMTATHCDGCTLELRLDGATDLLHASASTPGNASWPSDGQRHWILPEVVNAYDRPVLIGNPVYLNYP